MISSSSSLDRSSFFGGYGLNRLALLRSFRRWQKPFDTRLDAPASHQIDWPRMLEYFAKMMKQAFGESSSVNPYISLFSNCSSTSVKVEKMLEPTENMNSGSSSSLSEYKASSPYKNLQYILYYKKLQNMGIAASKVSVPLNQHQSQNMGIAASKVSVLLTQHPLSVLGRSAKGIKESGTSSSSSSLVDNGHKEQVSVEQDSGKKQKPTEQDSGKKHPAKVSTVQKIVLQNSPQLKGWWSKYWRQGSSKKTFDGSQNPQPVSGQEGPKVLAEEPKTLFFNCDWSKKVM